MPIIVQIFIPEIIPLPVVSYTKSLVEFDLNELRIKYPLS